MAKLASMFLILIAVQAVLLIYVSPSPENTAIWTFVNSMNQWGTTTFVLAMIGIASGILLTGIAAAGIFGFKTDFLIFAPAIAGFITMGVIFSNLAKFLQSQLISYIFTTCDLSTGFDCSPVNLIIAITIGPIALYYVWTIIEWWRGKDY